ncbi:hypothetical protein [Mesorhizobium sp. M0998]|uniref:hypothetical protein n=1 Tax=Mesorhizobium sp. M0998 TaxID=2957044 RepID=UPI0033354AB0
MGLNPLPVEIIGSISVGMVIGFDCAGRLKASRLILGVPYLVASILLTGSVCLAFSGAAGVTASELALLLGVTFYHAVRNSWGDR